MYPENQCQDLLSSSSLEARGEFLLHQLLLSLVAVTLEKVGAVDGVAVGCRRCHIELIILWMESQFTPVPSSNTVPPWAWQALIVRSASTTSLLMNSAERCCVGCSGKSGEVLKKA